MARIQAFAHEAAQREAQAVFLEIEKAFRRVPNLFKTMAHFPPLLRANWEKYKAVMLRGSLSRQGKETIALLVSQDNDCSYCVAAHRQALNALGLSQTQLEATVAVELAAAGLDSKEIQLVDLARMANRSPNAIPDLLFENLRQLGVTEAEIVETLGVVELFVGFNKFLDSLKVERDF